MFWSPDGRSVGFIADVDGQPGAFQAAADGTGAGGVGAGAGGERGLNIAMVREDRHRPG
jgi:Tol biopolymer transport system component